LIQESVSMKDLVDSLIHFASKREADLVLVTRHAKKGFRSLLLGSFSETLLFRSSVPVMLVGDQVQKFQNSRHILFPTEMGPRAYQLFKRTLKITADFRMSLTVFHSIEPPVASPLTYDTAAPLIPSRKAEVHSNYREEERIRKKLETWNRIAEREGVQMDYVLDSTSGGVWKKILKLASIRKSSIIIMEAHSEPFSSILLGSVTRQVVREAPCPVWILKPKLSAQREIHPGAAQAA
jgi:nucleotide-binding universal stress UspA family protein